MALEIQVIKAAEFIRINPQGKPDVLASRELLSRLATACRMRGVNRAMVDLRSLVIGPKPVFSPKDLLSLVNTFHELGFKRDQRLALLYGDDRHHRAKMFAVMGALQGWEVSAFGEYEVAVDWLMSPGKTEGREAVTGGEKVPVRRSPLFEAAKISRGRYSEQTPE